MLYSNVTLNVWTVVKTIRVVLPKMFANISICPTMHVNVVKKGKETSKYNCQVWNIGMP